ncbi:alpha/beta hydrolase fold protein [Pyronema domesticum]|nr:alpha/beta hydrolase fold protein [Pyronema domesticum]
MPTTEAHTCGYCPVNGLSIYYESLGTGGVPLLMLHGAFCTITNLRAQMVSLAKSRRVIAIESQGHGRTADIDRPLSYPQLADDAAGVLWHLEIPVADIYGYSAGGGIAQHLTIRHPELVRKLVIASSCYSPEGFPEEVLKGLKNLSMEHMGGSSYEIEYKQIAPDPEGFPGLVERIKELNISMKPIPEEDIRGIQAPTFVLMGDSDVIRAKHVYEMFKLRGGGVNADMVGLPQAQLAVIPGTSHKGMMERPWVAEMIDEFLQREVLMSSL